MFYAPPQPPVVSPPAALARAAAKTSATGSLTLKRPKAARRVTSAAITWHARDSFIQYIASGGTTTASAGATEDPASAAAGSSTPLVYQFHFRFARGWYDKSTHEADLHFTGTVTFSYASHGIQLSASNPELQLDGRKSRLIFTWNGSAGTTVSNHPAVLANLRPTRAKAAKRTTTSFAYSEIPGTVPGGSTASLLSSFYLVGDPFGWVSTSATTSR